MTIEELLMQAYDVILRPISLLLFAVAFVYFIWGLVEFIRDAEGDKGRETGKRNIIWGIVGMVIMVSVFGIINLIIGTIGAENPSVLPSESGFEPDVDSPL